MGLFVKRLGKGPPLVMLHGWGLNHAVWLDLAPHLNQHFRLHLVDLPGHGKSQDLEHYTLVDITRTLQEQFDHSAKTLLAWSLGALIALYWAANDPSIERLILVAGTPQFTQSENWPNAMNPQVLDDFSENLTADYQGTLWRFLSLQSLGASNNRKQIRRLRMAVLKMGRPSKAALSGYLQLLKTTDLRFMLKQIQCPVLLLQGEKDILVPAKAARVLARSLSDARIVILKQGSHAPFLSHQQPFLDELMAFLPQKG